GGLTEAEAESLERRLVPIPEPAAAEPDVPVGELLGVVRDGQGRLCAVEAVHLLADLGDSALQAGDGPAVELGGLIGIAGGPLRLVGALARLAGGGACVRGPE